MRYEAYDTVVELDGRLGHEYESAFRDRRRDNAAIVRGDVALRYGFVDVDEHPCDTAAQVALVLHARGWSAEPFRVQPRMHVDQRPLLTTYDQQTPLINAEGRRGSSLDDLGERNQEPDAH